MVSRNSIIYTGELIALKGEEKRAENILNGSSSSEM